MISQQKTLVSFFFKALKFTAGNTGKIICIMDKKSGKAEVTGFYQKSEHIYAYRVTLAVPEDGYVVLLSLQSSFIIYISLL